MQDNEFQVKAITSLVSKKIASAVSEGRWIDDMFVLELSQSIRSDIAGDIDPEVSRKIVYKCLVSASDHFNLGLKQQTLERLKNL